MFYCLLHLLWQCKHTFPMPIKPLNWIETELRECVCVIPLTFSTVNPWPTSTTPPDYSFTSPHPLSLWMVCYTPPTHTHQRWSSHMVGLVTHTRQRWSSQTRRLRKHTHICVGLPRLAVQSSGPLHHECCCGGKKVTFITDSTRYNNTNSECCG
jgi:hypothetical protein